MKTLKTLSSSLPDHQTTRHSSAKEDCTTVDCYYAIIQLLSLHSVHQNPLRQGLIISISYYLCSELWQYSTVHNSTYPLDHIQYHHCVILAYIKSKPVTALPFPYTLHISVLLFIFGSQNGLQNAVPSAQSATN